MMTEETRLPISEQFYSVQGEGEYAGHPAVFLRLQGCNLMCGGWHNREVEKQEDMTTSDEASWVCDTIATWREANEKTTVNDLVDDWDERGWLDKFRNGAHLILTGGEPTIPTRQHQLVDLLMTLEDRGASPFTEVETNGTIVPLDQFDARIDHYNVSMKLSNSGMDRDKRVNQQAIDWYKNRHELSSIGDAMFKFVISDDAEDIKEVENIVNEFDIPDDMVSLMPAGASQEQLEETYPVVADLCKQRGWKFSPRLHVNIWDMATGV